MSVCARKGEKHDHKGLEKHPIMIILDSMRKLDTAMSDISGHFYLLEIRTSLAAPAVFPHPSQHTKMDHGMGQYP